MPCRLASETDAALYTTFISLAEFIVQQVKRLSLQSHSNCEGLFRQQQLQRCNKRPQGTGIKSNAKTALHAGQAAQAPEAGHLLQASYQLQRLLRCGPAADMLLAAE